MERCLPRHLLCGRKSSLLCYWHHTKPTKFKIKRVANGSVAIPPISVAAAIEFGDSEQLTRQVKAGKWPAWSRIQEEPTEDVKAHPWYAFGRDPQAPADFALPTPSVDEPGLPGPSMTMSLEKSVHKEDVQVKAEPDTESEVDIRETVISARKVKGLGKAKVTERRSRTYTSTLSSRAHR